MSIKFFISNLFIDFFWKLLIKSMWDYSNHNFPLDPNHDLNCCFRIKFFDIFFENYLTRDS